jgi:hypothetical protein
MSVVWQFLVPSSLSIRTPATIGALSYNESPMFLTQPLVADYASMLFFRPSNVAMDACVAIST